MKSNKVLQVFEHDRLTTSNPLFESRHLNALLKLNEAHGFDYFEAIPNGVKFKQHVGVLQVDGLCIEILPKTDRDAESADWKGVLLQMLKACGHLTASSAGDAQVKRQHLNLLEVYFEAFLNEVDQLLRLGLVKKYRTNQGNVKALKGKLEFAAHIRYNSVHKERFFTSHQVYDTQHLLHQVLHHALRIVVHFSKGTYLFDRCKRLLLHFPEMPSVNITKQQLDSLVLNRKTAAYTKGLDLAKLIILNYSPAITSGKEKMISLLFDMNQLWESFILVQLRKELLDSVFEVKGQAKKSFIGNNFLQPDLVVVHKEDPTKVFVMDTKWKRPKNNVASIADLRQVYAYNRFWKAPKSILLYPGEKQNTQFRTFLTEDVIGIGEHSESIQHQCKLGYVNVLDSDNRLSKTIGRDILDLLEEPELLFCT